MNKYDVIIVGSGLGGLICGYVLAKHGFKILIVEKNAQIGGCLQTFRRNGVTFDTGMHYIGGLDEGQILRQFWDYLHLSQNIELQQLDKNCFDSIFIGENEYHFAQGYENFIETLCQQFPKQRTELQQYTDAIRKIAEASPLYDIRRMWTDINASQKALSTPVNQFIQEYISNPTLRQVLVGNSPLYAGVKDVTSTYIHALITHCYIQSAYRIIGGSDTIAHSLASSIKSFGGNIYTKSEVKEFVCNDTKMTGIKLNNGEYYEAKHFISNIHPQKALKLINSPLLRNAYRTRISHINNTISNFSVYMTFKPQTVPYKNHNMYHYNTNDILSSTNYQSSDWPKQYLFMHQCSQHNQEFAESAELMAYMSYDEVAQWQGTKIGERGEEYEQFKQSKAKLLLEELEKKINGIQSCISNIYTSSPLTYEDYTHTANGALYGIQKDAQNPLETTISQRTKIPNLFFTGQNIHAHGMLGVTMSAFLTCTEFIDVNQLAKEIY